MSKKNERGVNFSWKTVRKECEGFLVTRVNL